MLVNHGEYANGTHRHTVGRQTVTLRFRLDAASVIIDATFTHYFIYKLALIVVLLCICNNYLISVLFIIYSSARTAWRCRRRGYVLSMLLFNVTLVVRQQVDGSILWLICVGGDCTWAKICCTLVFKGHSLGGSSIASL